MPPTATGTGIRKLSPSDFAFLWDECKRCFYLKLVKGFGRASTPFPSMFGKIDGIQKRFFAGKNCQCVAPELGSGIFEYGEKWVESAPIQIPGVEGSCFIKGKFDNVIKFDDGAYAVVDFKTSSVKPEYAAKYARQLHAYAWCLTHPANARSFALSPITRIGLIVIEHDRMGMNDAGTVFYGCEKSWIEFDLDFEGFMGFLGEVMSVLALPEAPPADPNCTWCEYRDKVRRTGF